MKAIEFLEQSLKTRKKIIGDTCLPVAQALEILGWFYIHNLSLFYNNKGKVYLEDDDYKSALAKF